MIALLRVVVAFALIVLTSACSTVVTVPHETIPHMLSLNGNGKTFDIVDESGITELVGHTKDEKIEDHITKITKGLAIAIENNQQVELLIVVHGGLVSKKKSAKEATEVLNEIEIDNDNRRAENHEPYVYPIFVNWESGMGPAYKDHLLRVRQGRQAKYLGPLTSPFYLLADFGRAFTRVPITYSFQGYNTLKNVKVANEEQIAKYNHGFYNGNKPDGHGISLGEDTSSMWKNRLGKSTYIVPGVVKVATTPGLDMVGKSAWDNMLRRTKTMFRSPGDYKLEETSTFQVIESSNHPNLGAIRFDRLPQGGLSKLMRELRKFKRYQQAPNKKLTATLIGHSMGTIVMSELLRRFGDKEDLIYENIVYMAAACTIRDFEDSVVPYLDNQSGTNFYNLTLHPYAEENENFLYDLFPRGSLLVWIDDFASNPSTNTDRTLGRWNNAIQAWRFVPNKVRDRVTLKGFGIEDPITNTGSKPQEHGQFNDTELRFWRRKHWQVP